MKLVSQLEAAADKVRVASAELLQLEMRAKRLDQERQALDGLIMSAHSTLQEARDALFKVALVTNTGG